MTGHTEQKTNSQCGAATPTAAPVWNMMGRGDGNMGAGVAVKCSWMSIVDSNVASTDPCVLYTLVNSRVRFNLEFATVEVNIAR